MLAGEVLILLGIIAGSGIGIKALYGAFARSKESSSNMRKDLGDALASRDFKKLDDFLILWGDKIDGEHRKLIQIRRDSLYVDEDR